MSAHWMDRVEAMADDEAERVRQCYAGCSPTTADARASEERERVWSRVAIRLAHSQPTDEGRQEAVDAVEEAIREDQVRREQMNAAFEVAA